MQDQMSVVSLDFTELENTRKVRDALEVLRHAGLGTIIITKKSFTKEFKKELKNKKHITNKQMVEFLSLNKKD